MAKTGALLFTTYFVNLGGTAVGMKHRRAFNKQWRKDRKALKAAQQHHRQHGAVPEGSQAWQLAQKYNIEFPTERIR